MDLLLSQLSHLQKSRQANGRIWTLPIDRVSIGGNLSSIWYKCCASSISSTQNEDLKTGDKRCLIEVYLFLPLPRTGMNFNLGIPIHRGEAQNLPQFGNVSNFPTGFTQLICLFIIDVLNLVILQVSQV